jgi:hypothetical protein
LPAGAAQRRPCPERRDWRGERAGRAMGGEGELRQRTRPRWWAARARAPPSASPARRRPWRAARRRLAATAGRLPPGHRPPAHRPAAQGRTGALSWLPAAALSWPEAAAPWLPGRRGATAGPRTRQPSGSAPLRGGHVGWREEGGASWHAAAPRPLTRVVARGQLRLLHPIRRLGGQGCQLSAPVRPCPAAALNRAPSRRCWHRCPRRGAHSCVATYSKKQRHAMLRVIDDASDGSGLSFVSSVPLLS